ncbi:MAG: hypothetical protein ABI977_36755 [Acidobacteriota bacterium]
MKRKRRAKKRADEPGKAPSLKAQQLKVRKLQQRAAELEGGEHFNITRLVVIKSLVQDVKTATRFTLHLARLGQDRWDWKKGEQQFYSAAEIKQHRKLADEAFELLEAYLARRSDSRERQLRELLWQARQVNNEYRSIPYGSVRSIKSKRVLQVEMALYCALARDETAAGYWAYQAARDYAEQYDPRYGSGLIPPSAPLVTQIAEFWQAQYFDEAAAGSSAI